MSETTETREYEGAPLVPPGDMHLEPEPPMATVAQVAPTVVEAPPAAVQADATRADADDVDSVRTDPEDGAQDMERAFLGCMLKDRNTAAMGLKYLKPEQFYDQRCAVVARAIQSLVDSDSAVQTQTVIAYLRNNKSRNGKRLSEIADPEFVHVLALSAPSDPAFESYAKTIEDRWQRAELEDVTSHVNAGLRQGHITTAVDAMRALEEKLLSLAGESISTNVHDLMDSFLGVIQNISVDVEHAGEIVGIPTGIDGLDRLTGGLRGGQLIVSAGTPGSGKTSQAMNMAGTMAIDNDQPVLFFSLEMSNRELTQRIMSSAAEIPYENIRDRKLTEDNWGKIAGLPPSFRNAPLKIIDESDLSFLDIKSYAYQTAGEYEKPPVIFVDYLQLMNLNTGNRYSNNRNEATGDITRGLKNLAGELDVPIIVLSQLTKQSGFRDNKRPQLGDLRDSGSIGQDADMVIFMYRDDIYYPNSGDQSIAELIVEKHRAGGKGTLHLGFMKQFTKFINLADPAAFMPASSADSSHEQSGLGAANQVAIDIGF